MNAKIKELMIKSGAFDHYEINEGVDGDEVPMVKFAELVVLECARIAHIWSKEVPCSEGYDKFTVGMIKQHFGVE